MQYVASYYGETIRSQGAFYAAQGDGAVSHVDVRDIAAAAVTVLSGRGTRERRMPSPDPRR
jgi:uncharacterized protein YbjT (DUF2867 family)